MEPMRLSATSRYRTDLIDLAMELAAQASGLRRSLADSTLAALADLLRSMNCYYSNLIEGHDTHPIDIDRALKNDYSTNPEKRNLQIEALAHIAVQQWIDNGGVNGRALTVSGLSEIHQRFCERLPEPLLWIENSDNNERLPVIPGALRQKDVRVGQHIAISPGAIPRFLQQFERTYHALGKAETIIAAAAAHHRLLWIHPFLDGNGRVARLMSHAVLQESLESGGIWSIARGLARKVESYKYHLAQCDNRRRNDLDGRGHLSEESLAAFSRFFLETALDQIKFMEQLLQPEQMRERILRWAEESTRAGQLPQHSRRVIEALLYRGSLPRGEVAGLMGSSDRHARRMVASLIKAGIMVSETPRKPLQFAFPAQLAPYWLPGLFPEHH
ncbi:Fic family protein [Ectothiorhodospiraceae bacterium BW-2]|nr:Fic family protein [Ectothiorhodospiraceae bacterium BW-2]